MSAGTIACSYWTFRRGGCVGAASFAGRSGFLPPFSPLPPLASFWGFAWAGACFGAGFAAPLWSLVSFSDFASFVAILTSDVHDFAVGLEETHLARRGVALGLQELEAHAVALAGRRVHEHHVRQVDRRFLVDDAAGLALHGVRPLVL